MSKSGTITEHGTVHAKQRTRAQEWPKMMSTCTPDSSCGFLKSRHLENINSSNPNALNTDASGLTNSTSALVHASMTWRTRSRRPRAAGYKHPHQTYPNFDSRLYVPSDLHI